MLFRHFEVPDGRLCQKFTKSFPVLLAPFDVKPNKSEASVMMTLILLAEPVTPISEVMSVRPGYLSS